MPRLPDATTAAARAGLPEWNLSDLYPGTGSPRLKSDIDSAEADAAALEKRYKGRLAELSGDALGAAIADYERISEVLGRLSSYAQLLHAAEVSNPEIGRFYQTTQEKVTDISSRTLFFTLEINRIDDAVLNRQLKAKEASRYAPWLRDVRAFRPHQLSDDLEKLLHEKSVAGRNAWVRLFDETMAALRFEVDNRKLTATEVLHLLSNRNRDTRREAGKSFGHGLGE